MHYNHTDYFRVRKCFVSAIFSLVFRVQYQCWEAMIQTPLVRIILFSVCFLCITERSTFMSHGAAEIETIYWHGLLAEN